MASEQNPLKKKKKNKENNNADTKERYLEVEVRGKD